MRDPRLIANIFGAVSARSSAAGGGPTCLVKPETSENELRRSLATVAHAYGWIVEEEVQVPGWGRIDIVLRDGGDFPYLIELKLDLTRPAQIRKGLQQVDGYGRWWTKEYGEPARTYLVGLEIDRGKADDMADAYPSVSVFSAEQLLFGMRVWGTSHSVRFRAVVAAQRRRELQSVTDAYAAALAELYGDARGRAEVGAA